MDFPFDDIPPIPLFDLAHKVRFLVVNLSLQLILDQVYYRGVIKLVGRLRQVLSPVHTFQHRGIHCRTSNILLFLGAVTKPSVALEAQSCPMNSVLILHAPLDKKVITENLGHRTILLQLLSFFTYLLRETIQKIQGCSVRIQRGHR